MSDIEPVSINMNKLHVIEELNSILELSYITQNTKTFDKEINGEPAIVGQEVYKKIRSLMIELEKLVSMESILNSPEGRNASESHGDKNPFEKEKHG